MRTKELALLLLSPLSTVTGPRVAAPLFYPCSKCVNVVMFLNKPIVTLGNTVLALTMCTRCTTDCQNKSPSLCLLKVLMHLSPAPATRQLYQRKTKELPPAHSTALSIVYCARCTIC